MGNCETNVLSLISQCLDTICQIKTKVLQYPKIQISRTKPGLNLFCTPAYMILRPGTDNGCFKRGQRMVNVLRPRRSRKLQASERDPKLAGPVGIGILSLTHLLALYAWESDTQKRERAAAGDQPWRLGTGVPRARLRGRPVADSAVRPRAASAHASALGGLWPALGMCPLPLSHSP